MVLGCSIGAVSGGILMKIGRRNGIFIAIFIGLIANCISLYFTLYAILLGRFLFGLSAGLFSSIVPRYVEETVPNHLFDFIGPIYTLS